MAKKRDEFGTIKLTQEELLGKITPKKVTPPPPKPPPEPPKPPAGQALPPGQSSKELPALKPPPAPGAKTPGELPAVKPPAKPAKTVLERRASEVCAQAGLSDEAKPHLANDPTVQVLVQALQEQTLLLDALKVLAHALPRREVIGWGLHCVKQIYGPNPTKAVGAVFHATQLWLGDPNDTHRRLAFEMAEAAEPASPAGCIGLAVFFSGGSMAPMNAPAVAPAPHLTSSSVANALHLAGVLTEPEKAPEKYALFLADGLKLAAIVPYTNGVAKPGAA